MKRMYFWIVILALVLVSVNNRESVEISERSLIHAVGIDQTDKGITVTLQVFKSSGAGSDTQIDPSKSNTFVISNTAATFDEAIGKCESQLGNYLFIGHNQIIVLGSGVKLDDPNKLLSYFIKNKNNYLGVSVVMAENTAKEIMEVELTSGAIASENFTDIINMYYNNGETVFSDMLHFLNSMKSRDKSAVIPVVSVKELSTQSEDSGQESSEGSGGSEQESGSSEENSSGAGSSENESSSQDSSSSDSRSSSESQDSSESGSKAEESSKSSQQEGQSGGSKESGEEGSQSAEKLITIEKAAVISGGKVKGYITGDEIKGVNWITDHMHETVINTEIDGKSVGVTVKKRSSKTKLEKKDNKLVYKIDIKAIILTDTNILAELDENELEKKVEEKIRSDCEAAIKKAYYEYNADCLNVTQLVKFYYPQIYLDYMDDFNTLKQNIKFETKAKCYVK